MLAQLSRELPSGDYLYEPKWDGFRCLAFVAGGRVELQSRHCRPLARYFPELVEALRALRAPSFVLDGEIVIAGAGGLDFPALLARLHPSARRVEQLRRASPATLIAFDLLAVGARDLRGQPFEERRAALEALLAKSEAPLLVTPSTSAPEVARDWLDRFQGAGIDGVVAKHRALPYQPGRRAMIKVKNERTAECVVAGFRVFSGEPTVASLLLGLQDGGVLRHVGVCSSFRERQRRELFEELRPLLAPIESHPWRDGFNLGRNPIGRLAGSAGRWDPSEMLPDWLPVRPERVCEVAYDQVDEGRFRHAARFLRWRPDRDPSSCGLDQLAPEPLPPEVPWWR